MREFDATNDKRHFHIGADVGPDRWPVYVYKGASFNLWGS